MTLTMPETTDSYGQISVVVLTNKPASLASIPVASITAGENVSCHLYGDWMPTASTDKVSRQRKMCQTKIARSLGTTTWETPAFQYSYRPQSVGTAGAPGNEAYEAMPEGAVVYAVQRLGKDSRSALAAGDKIRVWPLELGPQVPGVSADDAGGEFVINQEASFASGYDSPVDGVVAP